MSCMFSCNSFFFIMKTKFIIFLLFQVALNCPAQNKNNVWIFGDSAGIDFNNINNPVPVFSGMDGRGSCASISDSAGSLLFYCFENMMNDQSVIVHSFTNDTMTNGINLNGQGEYNQITIIPIPEELNKYYIFHNGFYTTQGFYYSEVDMSLNSGLGEIVQKNIPLIPNTRMADCVQAVKHGNGRDWWVVSKLSSDTYTHVDKFFVQLVSPSGISNPIDQSFGNCTDLDFQKIIFNNKADKLMVINLRGFMCQYNFDRCSGVISNPNIIFPELTSNFNRYFWEGAYSPNDSLFYATTEWVTYPQDTSRLLQFNLFAPDIPLSCDTLFEGRSPYLFGAVRLAPDKKIYMANMYNWGFPGYPYPDNVYNQFNMNLSVINLPDSQGAACNFQPFSFYLGGKRTYAGLPNNPNYSLGPDTGSICDTLPHLGVATNEFQIQQSALHIFYHSTLQTAFINAQGLHGKNYSLQLFDLTGRNIFSEQGKLHSEYFSQNFQCPFSNGIYIITLTTEKENLTAKFIIQ